MPAYRLRNRLFPVTHAGAYRHVRDATILAFIRQSLTQFTRARKKSGLEALALNSSDDLWLSPRANVRGPNDLFYLIFLELHQRHLQAACMYYGYP